MELLVAGKQVVKDRVKRRAESKQQREHRQGGKKSHIQRCPLRQQPIRARGGRGGALFRPTRARCGRESGLTGRAAPGSSVAKSDGCQYGQRGQQQRYEAQVIGPLDVVLRAPID